MNVPQQAWNTETRDKRYLAIHPLACGAAGQDEQPHQITGQDKQGEQCGAAKAEEGD